MTPATVRPPSADFSRGTQVDTADLEEDPYPTFRVLREAEPVSWIPALRMWWATEYATVRAVLLDPATYAVDAPGSPIRKTFGRNMLSTDGPGHARQRDPVQPFFGGAPLRETLQPLVAARVDSLLKPLWGEGEADLRTALASRLPVQVMLGVLGLPLEAEPGLRAWYDVFEAALGDVAGEGGARMLAERAVVELHALLDAPIARARRDGGEGLVARLAAPDAGLADDEIRRNLSIIVFGGVSTVEALILNTLYALLLHPAQWERVRREPQALPAAIEETLRWLSPVQSAGRHLQRDVRLGGADLREGDTLACMLGAANHDPAVFERPETFDPDRPNAARHLAFAAGPHMCVGLRLAKLEARLAIEALLAGAPGLEAVDLQADRPRGYEFRQPRALRVRWRPR